MASYQADLGRFEALNTHVLGISVDSVPCKTAWAKSLGGLGFDLLSDFFPHGGVAERYGVLRPEGFAERAVFLVDRRGRIAFARVYEIPKQPDTNEVVSVLEGLRD